MKNICGTNYVVFAIYCNQPCPLGHSTHPPMVRGGSLGVDGGGWGQWDYCDLRLRAATTGILAPMAALICKSGDFASRILLLLLTVLCWSDLGELCWHRILFSISAPHNGKSAPVLCWSSAISQINRTSCSRAWECGVGGGGEWQPNDNGHPKGH